MKCSRCANENDKNRTDCWFCGAILPKTDKTIGSFFFNVEYIRLNLKKLGIYAVVAGFFFYGFHLIELEQQNEAEHKQEKLDMLRKLENAERLRKEAERRTQLANEKVDQLPTNPAQAPTVIPAEVPRQLVKPILTDPIDAQIESIVRQHFAADNNCDVEATMSFYAGGIVTYDNISYDKEGLRNIKQKACERLPGYRKYSIRNDSINITAIGNSYKIVDYTLDWEVFSPKLQHNKSGITRVRIKVNAGLTPPKIVSENHYKL